MHLEFLTLYSFRSNCTDYDLRVLSMHSTTCLSFIVKATAIPLEHHVILGSWLPAKFSDSSCLSETDVKLIIFAFIHVVSHPETLAFTK